MANTLDESLLLLTARVAAALVSRAEREAGAATPVRRLLVERLAAALADNSWSDDACVDLVELVLDLSDRLLDQSDEASVDAATQAECGTARSRASRPPARPPPRMIPAS